MAAQLPVERFQSNSGVRIYRLPLEAFPGFIVYAYLLLEAGPPTLVDTGSGFGLSNDHLVQAVEQVRDRFNESIAFRDIRRILISHGHIDHSGGVAFAVEQTGAEVAVHALDRRVLTAYEERIVVATKDLRVYLQRAGVREEMLTRLIEMYGFTKAHVRSVQVGLDLNEETELDGLRFIHTPGHCPGQVCIRIGDILLSADHVLARTSPHQAPESITHYTGLGHYLESLGKVEREPGIRLALGGHEEPIEQLYDRIAAIRASHQRKLERILGILRESGEPCTISQISKGMYPERHGYEVLLALEEVGAHVEYLYQRGHLAVCNLDEVEREDNPALQYGLA